ncbi:hypothetical protein RUND412_007242 [Rhizina undulata]
MSEEAKIFMRGFEDLMTAAFLANARLYTLKTYWLWSDVLPENSQFLSNMQLFQNLTSLSIYFASNLTSNNFSTLPENIYVWQNLETFLYDSGPINGADLMDLLAHHATTLKTLGLNGPHLRNGTWKGIFDFNKGIPELSLEKLVLINASEELNNGGIQYYNSESDKKNMIDYVLHGGPSFPPTEAELEQQGLRED